MGALGLAIAVFLACAILWIMLSYNFMVSRHNKIDMVWDELESYLKMRRSLLPGLVEAGGEKTAEVGRRLEEITSRMPEGLTGYAITPFEREISIVVERVREIAERDEELMLDTRFVAALAEVMSTEGGARAACERGNALVREFIESAKQPPAKYIVRFIQSDMKEADIFG